MDKQSSVWGGIKPKKLQFLHIPHSAASRKKWDYESNRPEKGTQQQGKHLGRQWAQGPGQTAYAQAFKRKRPGRHQEEGQKGLSFTWKIIRSMLESHWRVQKHFSRSQGWGIQQVTPNLSELSPLSRADKNENSVGLGRWRSGQAACCSPWGLECDCYPSTLACQLSHRQAFRFGERCYLKAVR